MDDQSPSVDPAVSRADRPPILIVISDLHIGSGPLDDFDAQIELQFVAFISELIRRPEPVELIINGDFLEFVQADPWQDPTLKGATSTGVLLCFTEAQSLTKLRNILKSHPNVFRALGSFLAKAANRLVIVPGNHDVDLFWCSVRKELRAKLEESAGMELGSRLRYYLGRVYRPALMPTVWVEHGHQVDINNCFYVGNNERWSEAAPPMLAGADGEMRLLACIGTRFLGEYINRLDQTYPFVDNVKPFSKFVKMFLVSSALFRFGTPVRVAIAAWGILRFLAKTRKQSINALLSADGQQIPSFAVTLQQAWKELSEAKKEELIEALRSRQIEIEVPIQDWLSSEEFAGQILDVLADNFDLVSNIFPEPNDELLSAGGEPGTLGFVGGFIADETGALIQAAQSAIQYSDAKVVIMGHTHEPQDHPDGLNYVNTGSWTRYLRIVEGETEPSSWSLLKAEAIGHFPFKLLYAEVHTSRPDNVLLKTWRCAS